MFKLEESIQSWKHSMKSSPAFEEGQLKEMETHLRDEIESYIENGYTEEEAFNRAASKFGMPEHIGDEVYKTKTVKKDATPPWKQSKWISGVLPNYLKVSLRSLKNDLAYSSINIIGLAVGLACTLIISLWVAYEFSYDDHHRFGDRIVRLVTNVRYTSGDYRETAFSFPQWGDLLEERYPEVENSARLMKYRSDLLVKKPESDQKIFYESNFVWADSTVFDILTIPFLAGDAIRSLAEPYSLVISSSTAKKYFDDANPIGQQLELDWGGIKTFTITGVYKDIPETSHFNADFLGTFLTIEETWSEAIEERALYFYTYLKLVNKNSILSLSEKLPEFLGDVEGSDFADRASLELQQVENIHLYSQRDNELKPTGNISFIYTMITIAILILCIAAVNYVNLTTSRSTLRSKEVGIRKVMGSSRKALIAQFFTETFIQVLIAVALSLFISYLFLPYLNGLLSKNFGFSAISPLILTGSIAAGLAVVVLLSGFYPATAISRLDPVSIFKSSKPNLATGSGLRKGMVTFQFIITSVLVIATITVFQQNNFISNRNLGFDRENIIIMPIRSEELSARKQQLRNYFQDAEIVQESSLSSHQMGGQIYRSSYTFGTPSGEVEEVMNRLHVDHGFLDTYGLNLAAGRFFKRGIQADTSRFVINESAARRLGMSPDEAVGREVSYIANGENGMYLKDGTVIGVVNDFNQRSLHHTVEPLVMDIVPDRFQFLSLRLRAGDLNNSVDQIRSLWNGFAGPTLFEYWFLDNALDELYQTETKTAAILGFFAFIAITLGCVGLFALTAYVTSRRTREIGIRRVLGAGVYEIVGLLMKNYVVLIVSGFLISIPLSWYFLTDWLYQYAYRIDLGWEIYMVSFLLVAILAVTAMSIQFFKAAYANPVESLRSE